MKHQTGYLITLPGKKKEFFTASSAYDRPKWVPLEEATVYYTVELAQAARKKLIKSGVFEAQLVSVSELVQFEFPNGEIAVSGKQDSHEGDPRNEYPKDEMVASSQEQVCPECEHDPCTCEHEDSVVQPEENEENAEGRHRFSRGQRVSYKGSEFVVADDSGTGVAIIQATDGSGKSMRVANVELMPVSESAKITATMVQKAKDRADAAGLAVERAQQKSGYAKSNDKVRELKVKASKLRNGAHELEYKLKQQEHAVNESVQNLTDGELKRLIDSKTRNALAHNLSQKAASQLDAAKAELARRKSSVKESETMPAKPPLDGKDTDNTTTAATLNAKIDKIDLTGDARANDFTVSSQQHDDKINVPANVLSDLKSVIDEFTKEANDKNTRDDTRASFCMTVASAFQQLMDDLKLGTVGGVKQAQIHVTSWMNPITSHLPVSVQKFVYMGGQKPTLKNLFDEKREDKKRAE